jgi:hypothetical protein
VLSVPECSVHCAPPVAAQTVTVMDDQPAGNTSLTVTVTVTLDTALPC